MSDNTHLLKQVEGLLSKSGGATALIEAKISGGRIRLIVGTMASVGDVDGRSRGSKSSSRQRGSMYLKLTNMSAYERSAAQTKEETRGEFRGMRLLSKVLRYVYTLRGPWYLIQLLCVLRTASS